MPAKLDFCDLLKLSFIFIFSACFDFVYSADAVDFTLQQSAAVKVISSDNSLLSATFELPELNHHKLFINNCEYDGYSLTGETPVGPVGWPELPSVVRHVLIPPGSGVQVQIKNVRARFEDGINPVPRQTSDAKYDANSDIQRWNFQGREDIYTDPDASLTNGFWPGDIIRLGKPVVMRGYRIIPVIIFPLRWNASTRQLQVIESIEFELDFPMEVNNTNPARHPEYQGKSINVQKMMERLVINPSLPKRDPELSSGSILYIIPDMNDVAESIQPLAEWRRRMGWTVEVVRIEDNLDREDILDAIQERYDHPEGIPPEFIVLVGDAPHTPGNHYVLAYWNIGPGLQWPYETDHCYTCLEGDDIIPDVAIGRFPVNSINMLNGMVNKIIQYESEPFIGEGDAEGWQKRGAVCAINANSGPSTIDLCRWSKEVMIRNDYQNVSELYYTHLQPSEDVWIPNQIEAGISMFLFRGELWMGGYGGQRFVQLDALRNEGMYPFMIIATCNTGDYAEHTSGDSYHSEKFATNPSGGGIGAIGTSGSTHTTYNNILSAGILRAPFVDSIYTQGWAVNMGKLDLYRNYSDRGDIEHERVRMDNWMVHTYIYNLMGDPAVDLYTDAPQPLIVEHNDHISCGETKFDVSVEYDLDENIPAKGILVCLYKPDEFQLTSLTDANGNVSFTLDPDYTQDGTILLTISGHNLYPYLADLPVEEGTFIGMETVVIDDDNEGESRGDDDGIANPMERIELQASIKNWSEIRPEGELNVRLESEIPYINIIEDEFLFEEAPLPGEAQTATFIVEIGAGCKVKSEVTFRITASTDEEEWESSFSVPIEGFKLEIVGDEWLEDPLRRNSNSGIRFTLRNEGTKTSPALNVKFLSLTRGVSTEDEEVFFGDIQVHENRATQGWFNVAADRSIIGNQAVFLGLEFSCQQGICDTVFFTVNVQEPEDDEPFGPDGYGYLCVDNTDVDWFEYPEYEWIEIDPALDGHGEDTGLEDMDDLGDESLVMDLPFVFQYYGEEFDQVTICTNGWIALGNHLEINTFCNRRIPGGLVTSAMICPFWDNLVTTENGGIYTWHDPNDHRFVVEWSNMRRLGPAGENEADETFEVILYNPVYHPSFTGDADILFQYAEVTDEHSCFQLWDTPFATVGIGSPDLSDGIEYSYWGERKSGAAPLENGLAIRFTTMVELRTGRCEGTVLDFGTGEPLEGVLISASYGFFGVTDEEGHYAIEEMLSDTLHEYTFTASCQWYNDSTVVGQEILPDATLELNFALRHPEFLSGADSLVFRVTPNSIYEFGYDIINTGNGLLWYVLNFDYLIDRTEDNRRDEDWDMLYSWDVTDSVPVFDDRINAVVFDGKHWIVAGSTDIDTVDYFYRFDRYGQYIDELSQGIDSRLGMRDMEYYNGSIYGVYILDIIVRIDPETGQIQEEWEAPENINSLRAFTIDPDSGYFYTSTTSSDIYKLALDGDSLVLLDIIRCPIDPRDGERIRRYGLSWFRDDPDHMSLYMTSDRDIEMSPDKPDISVYKMNPWTGETAFVTDIAYLEPSFRAKAGCCITPRWNNMVWVMATILDHPEGDVLGLFELGPNASWLNISPRSDTLDAGETAHVNILIDTYGMNVGDYGMILRYEINANPGIFRIPLRIFVDSLSVDGETHLPYKFDLSQNWPNPFNYMTNISYSVDSPGLISLVVYDLSGRRVTVIEEGFFNPGEYQKTVDMKTLPSGVYFCKLECSGRALTRKLVLLK